MHLPTRNGFFAGRESEGGQAIILITITFLALTMAVGLAIDAGQLFVARRTMQEAADAAAYAGAVVRYQGGSVPSARSAAIADATRNGYTDGVAGFTVTVNAPPTSGLYVGNDEYVEVIIQGSVRTALVPAQSALTVVHVRGVAGAEPLNNGYAVIALDKGNTPDAFYAGPNADIHLTGGGILVDSSSTTAATSDQCDLTRFTIGSPYGTDVAGTGTGCFPTTGDGLDNNQPQQADPFSGFPKPSTTGMTTYNALPNTDPTVLMSGVYTVQIGGAGHTNFDLTSGIYILKAGIDLGGNADISSLPGGVFIFNTHTNYPGAFRPGIDTCGVINLQGNAQSELNAMTTGTYANFLVYQDPACTNQMSIAGSQTAVFTGTGTIYLPNATFTLDGNNATLTGSQLVAKKVNIQNGNLSIDFNAGNTAQPILPRLSE
jgi:hypothetical protein